MSPQLNDGAGGYLVLLAIAALAHEPWRWLGFLLGRNVAVGSEVFLWVRSVATALVAGLVMKLVVFPAGTLAAVPLGTRAVALVGGAGLYLVSRGSLALGVAGGAAILAVMEWVRGGG